jgi:hypothetical protein
MASTRPGTVSWPNLIAQWRLSGLTQAEFCSRRGLALPTFRYHLYKPSRGSGSPGPTPTAATNGTPLFLPVVCPPPPQRDGLLAPPASAIEVILSDGLRIAITPGFDPQTLQRVVDALRRPPC